MQQWHNTKFLDCEDIHLDKICICIKKWHSYGQICGLLKVEFFLNYKHFTFSFSHQNPLCVPLTSNKHVQYISFLTEFLRRRFYCFKSHIVYKQFSSSLLLICLCFIVKHVFIFHGILPPPTVNQQNSIRPHTNKTDTHL